MGFPHKPLSLLAKIRVALLSGRSLPREVPLYSGPAPIFYCSNKVASLLRSGLNSGWKDCQCVRGTKRVRLGALEGGDYISRGPRFHPPDSSLARLAPLDPPRCRFGSETVCGHHRSIIKPQPFPSPAGGQAPLPLVIPASLATSAAPPPCPPSAPRVAAPGRSPPGGPRASETPHPSLPTPWPQRSQGSPHSMRHQHRKGSMPAI